MKLRLRKPPLGGVLLLGGVVLAVLLWQLTDIGCVWRHFLGFRCPLCGMTRAAKRLLVLDFRGAVALHPMVLSLPFAAVYLLYCGRPFKSHRLNCALGAVFLLGLAVCYIVSYL